jgi:hypothetical protein
MIFCWRITKYDPQYRNHQGTFLREEWTSYSDIGKSYNNVNFNYQDYLDVETLYINAIQSIMACCGISSLKIVALEKPQKINPDEHTTNEMLTLFKTVKEGDSIDQSTIKDFCRLILREQLWCKLIADQKMYVHFGYDFYMYIGSSLPCDGTIALIKDSGLFVEPFKSPY